MAKILKHGKNYIEEAKKAYKDVIVQCPECNNTICTSYYYLEVATDVPCECECGCRFLPEVSDVIKKPEAQKLAAWEHCTYTPGGIHDKYSCTNCGFKTSWTTDFCGGCGAYMRGDFNG